MRKTTRLLSIVLIFTTFGTQCAHLIVYTYVCFLFRLTHRSPPRASPVIPDRGTWLTDHRVADADALAFRELYALDNTVQVHTLRVGTDN